MSERKRECVCVWEKERVCECVCVCERERESECVCVCLQALSQGGSFEPVAGSPFLLQESRLLEQVPPPSQEGTLQKCLSSYTSILSDV